MTAIRDLLIEIGTEELPPKALKNLSEAFSSALCNGLEQQQIDYSIAIPYATPRRLAVLIKGVATAQGDRPIERRGPPLIAAFDQEGQPTKAATGFAQSCGVDVNQLERVETDKGIWLVHRSIQAGQTTSQLIPDIITTALASLPIPKRMRWSNLSFEFVRPVHWVVILFDEEIIPAQILGVHSGRQTRGHRFHCTEPLTLEKADDYAKVLEKQGHVIPLFSVRRERIRNLVEQAAEEIDGQAIIDEALLDEVTSLVEWPTAIVGTFEDKFLQVPPEALIAAMKNHQRCFHVVNLRNQQLLPKFIGISNINSTQPALVRAGYERVIRPRLSDAAFFWQKDQATPLDKRLDQLKTVIFQNQLGSLYDKSKRVAAIAGIIAKQLNCEELQGIRAAQLSKCDLMTEMVNEFPELQGIMGQYYARHDGETEGVATALREQYMPRFWGDELPMTPLGQALSIADKLDTLVGIFGINNPPTGDKDPFGLRRAALGILRIIIERELPLDIYKLLQVAQAAYPKDEIQTQAGNEVYDFILERLRGYYQDKGINYDTIDAVLSCRPHSPLDVDHRIRGVEAFRNLPDIANLVSANKRIHNILKKVEGTFPNQLNPTYFNHAVERQLYDKMETVNAHSAPLIKQGDYQAALQHLAGLREAIDNFFDNVMVMEDDIKIRHNRLAFLQSVRQLFLQIADISRLQL